MLDQRPTATELVAAVAGFLDSDIAPALTGRLAFHARVAANALRIVERELTAGQEVVAGELAGLRALTGTDGDLPTLNATLAAMIRDGELSIEDTALREHLLRGVLARLAIDNPRYPSLREVTGDQPDHGGTPT